LKGAGEKQREREKDKKERVREKRKRSIETVAKERGCNEGVDEKKQ
jgi:hypothetical protein